VDTTVVADTQAATVDAADTLDAALIPVDRSFAAVVTPAVTQEAATRAAVVVTPAAVVVTHAAAVVVTEAAATVDTAKSRR
jgi:hypothetical protein